MGTLKLAISNLVDQTLQELAANTASSLPTAGTVTSVNDDGTVNVTTAGGNFLPSVGAATTDVQVIGKQVMVISGDGRQTAVPR